MDRRILLLVKNDSMRKSLSSALRGVLPDAHIVSAKDVSSAAFQIEKEIPFRFVFIQLGNSQKEIINLISVSKRYDVSQKVRFILVVPEGQSDEDLLSKHLSLGFSGMLIEPFSLHAIKEVMQVSDTLTMAGSVARLTVAAGLQIKSHLVEEKRMGSGGELLDSVRLACQIFESENPGQTVKGVAEELLQMPVEDRIKVNVVTLYRGVSARVRQLVSKKSPKIN